MHRFLYRRAESVEAAIEAASPGEARSAPPPVQAPGQFIAGGTNMTDYMALDVMRPDILVDINRLPAGRYGRIEAGAQGCGSARWSAWRRPRTIRWSGTSIRSSMTR